MKKWRINLVFLLIFLFAAAIAGRLVFLQIIQHDFYAALAQGQQKFFISSQGERGEIFFQGHQLPIATNKDFYFVYASPAEIPRDEKSETAEILSEILGMDKEHLLAKFQKDTLYEPIKERLEERELESLRELNLSGVTLSKERFRSYPYQDFASHILGFVNKGGGGQYGVEEYWNDVLTGQESVLEGASQKNLENRGADIFLTIDYNIQYLAEKLLKRTHQQLNIDGGTIIVMDPNEGKILALAEYPNFDPNSYYQERDFQVFQTDAIQKIFEPGSVFKPVTMAGALNEGAISPQTTYTDPGVLNIGGWPIYNYDQRVYQGAITMVEVLEKSINTGAVFVESQLGHQKFLEYIQRFGVFEKSGVDLAGEISSQNKELQKGYEAGFATASFGQGIEMTPIQIARVFGAIANGGKLVRPYLVEKIARGGEIIEIEPEISDNDVISFDTASQLTAMLVSVVENGFGRAAKVPGYYVAGKTGTAQMSFSALGISKEGYSDNTWQNFIGFAPAFDPKFLILIKLNNPAAKTAEYSAVPIFKELAKYIIDYQQIPPDYAP